MQRYHGVLHYAMVRPNPQEIVRCPHCGTAQTWSSWQHLYEHETLLTQTQTRACPECGEIHRRVVHENV